MQGLQQYWIDAAIAVGVAEPDAAAAADDLARRYAEPHRRYHKTSHVLAVVGAAPDTYDGYAAAVRAEYAAVPGDAWVVGRTHVLTTLLAREHVYLTEAGRRRWDTAMRDNVARELFALHGTTNLGE